MFSRALRVPYVTKRWGSGMATEQQSRAAWAEEQVAQFMRSSAYSGVHALIRSRGFNSYDADDILAICIAAVYVRLVEKGPVRGSLVAYFTKAVRNEIAQYAREESRKPVDLPGDEVLSAQSAGPSPAGASEAALLTQERQKKLEAIHAAFEELPDHLREPYEIELYVGLPPKEIASILGKPPESVRSSLSVAETRVRERVAELLQPGEGGEGEEDE
jgi:RNA polymerase sigma factor (sigma-70 family)